MQQKKNIRLLISLIALSAITVLLFLFGNSNRSEVDKSIFKVADQNAIDKVIFESAKGKTELKFDGAKWKVNATREADGQLVTVFFASILQAEPKRKVTGAQQDSIKIRMQKEGVKVSLWEGEKQAKEFWVVGNEQKTETYFQLKDDEPYFVTIPGYRVYVASIFELAENDWRNKKVFNFNWQNFKNLKTHFPQQSNQDFTISFSNKLFAIEEVAVADTTKLSGYLESIFNLQAEKILTKAEAAQYDSVFAIAPIAEIEIQDIAKHTFGLKIYRSKEKNIVAAKMQDEAVLLKPQAVAGVVRRRDYFVLR
jgi:Domain of unknown function (DUF4340)